MIMNCRYCSGTATLRLFLNRRKRPMVSAICKKCGPYFIKVKEYDKLKLEKTKMSNELF